MAKYGIVLDGKGGLAKYGIVPDGKGGNYQKSQPKAPILDNWEICKDIWYEIMKNCDDQTLMVLRATNSFFGAVIDTYTPFARVKEIAASARTYIENSTFEFSGKIPRMVQKKVVISILSKKLTKDTFSVYRPTRIGSYKASDGTITASGKLTREFCKNCRRRSVVGGTCDYRSDRGERAIHRHSCCTHYTTVYQTWSEPFTFCLFCG